MKKFLIAYEFDGGSQGWMTVHAEDQLDAFEYFYTSDIDGKAIFVVEVMDIPTVEA